MSITIQLDGSALSKLIDLSGGDKFVLELRKGVMENVLGTRVKGLCSEVIAHGTQVMIAAAVAREIGEVKTDYRGKVENIKLSPDILLEVSRVVNDTIDAERRKIRQSIEDAAKSVASKLTEDFAERIESSVNSKIDRLTETYIRDKVTERFKQALGNLNV